VTSTTGEAAGEIGVIAGIPADPGLPAAAPLLGDVGLEQVSRFLAARGWRLRHGRPVQVLYRPGRSCLVRFRVTADEPAGAPRLLNVCVETRAHPGTHKPASEEVAGRYGLPEPLARDGPYLVWAFPCDPAMPHLADAAWAPAVRDRLALDGPRPLRVRVHPVRYRPRRRAVFRYRATYRGNVVHEFYGKALRTLPARRMSTIAAHVGSVDAGPRRRRRRTIGDVRLSLPVGQLERNTLLFEPMAGTPLGRLLVRGGSLPRPARIAAVLDDLGRLDARLATEPASRHRTSPVETAETTAALLGTIAPACADDVAAVVEAVHAGAARPGPDLQVVHGDLYEGQIFVDDDFRLGLIDLEELGLGDPALDAANFTAHLLAFALVAPAARARLTAYRLVLREAFLGQLDLPPAMLAWREALVMLQLATGPFRTLAPDWPTRVARSVRVAARLAEEAST
jgi:hypothetical protein